MSQVKLSPEQKKLNKELYKKVDEAIKQGKFSYNYTEPKIKDIDDYKPETVSASTYNKNYKLPVFNVDISGKDKYNSNRRALYSATRKVKGADFELDVDDFNITDKTDSEDLINTINDVLRETPNKRFNIRYVVPSYYVGKMKKDKLPVPPDFDIDLNLYKSKGDSYNIILQYFLFKSETFLWEFYNNKGKIYITEIKQIKKTPPKWQKYLDGPNHCFFSPMINVFKNKCDSVESKRSKYRYLELISKCEKYMVQYADGIPENDIQKVIDDLQISITIHCPFSVHTDSYKTYTSAKKSNFSIKFINSRIDHVELIDKLIDTNNIEFVECVEDLTNIVDNAFNKKEYCTYKKNLASISEVYTNDKVYKVKSNVDYRNTVNEFIKKYNMSSFKIDNSNQKLFDFVLSSCHLNLCVDFEDTKQLDKDDPSILHIDQEQSYANFKKCHLYDGFLGKITDFRPTDKHETIGLYYVDSFDLTNANPKFKFYNDYLDICKCGVFPSPDLKLFDFYNVKYKIRYGAYGSKFDFDFPKNMTDRITAKINGIPYYSKFAGELACISSVSNYYMKKIPEFAEHVYSNYQNNESISINENKDEIILTQKKDYISHSAHILAFLTSYSRISTIEQLMNMNEKKIIRVCSDGIYFYDSKHTLLNNFKKEEHKTFKNQPAKCYLSSFELNNIFPDSQPKPYFKNELYLGAGGCGKTHLNLTDKGLIKPLFCSPTWDLANDKKNQYNVNVCTHQGLLNSSNDKMKLYQNYYNVIIVDECSMLSEHQKNQIMEKYKMHKLIFCGDLNYQIGPFESKPMNESNFNKVYYLTENYRIKCNELKKNLENIRNNINDTKKIKIKIQKIKLNQLIETYDINDVIISHTNLIKDQFTNQLKDKFTTEKKYYVTETKDHFKYQVGNIYILTNEQKEQMKEATLEERYAFTAHSIQGRTFKNRIFIHPNVFDSPQLLYTAMSRAEYNKQIYLID